MTSVVLYGLGARCRVHLAGGRAGELADAVAVAWSRCLAASGVEGEPVAAADVTVALHDEPTPDADVAGSDLDRVLQALTQTVTMRFIAAQTGRLVMLHAGAVAHPVTGEALAFVAPGGTGKTTLARALGDRLAYLTDETVGCTADGVIAPYPKPLSVRAADPGGGKHELSPDALGLLPTPDAARLRRIVLLDRRDGVSLEVTELDVVSAIAALAPESSALSALPRPLHLVADLLDARPPTLRLTYAEASDAVDLLVDLLEER